MFTTGFTMNGKDFGEPINGRTTEWMLNKASEKQACITGSFISTDGKNYYNTLLWAYPNGKFQYYHKRHLFRMAGEHLYYTAGNEKIICEYKGFRFLPLICYDLRFPVWSRNQLGNPQEYDILIYVANWPEVRIDAWKKLLYARAIENLSYAIGVNRIGKDGTNKTYNGQSMVVDFKGELLADAGDKENIVIMDLDKEELMQFREKFPAYLDADDFLISVK
ncbi:MAG: nitrilase family protein [Bacteroidetes bacterium]|nr:MAG: nitrilase family protein [Bacteroidota bacterium]